MKKILVTGAGGLLGAHVVQLLADEAEIVAAGHSAPKIAAPNVTPLALDLSRPLDRAALPQRVDVVIHLAQSSRFREFPETAGDIFEVNTARLVDLIDYARRAGAANFVYASTGGVYGGGPEPLGEDAPAPPAGEILGFYPASKRAGELLAEAFSSQLNVAVLRYFFIYGPGQKRGMLIPRLVDSVREGRSVTLQGESGLRCNPIHAEDAARATVAAAGLDRSATVNVAGPEILSLRQICEAIGRRLGRRPVLEVQPGEPRDLIADISLMESLLIPPARRFEDGVADLL